VRLLTPDVRQALQWFEATHRLEPTMTGVAWRRIALPHAGAVGEQDARLMEQLDVIEETFTAVTRERQRAAADAETTRAWREQRERAARDD